MTLPGGVQAFFVLNAANRSKENEKLSRTMWASLSYTTMKETLKKVFSDISSLQHKNAPIVKEEVKTINFNHYKNVYEKRSYQGWNGVNLSDKQGRLKCCFKCNSAQHFVHDYAGLRNNINTVIDSDQIYFTLFNVFKML